MGNTNTRQEGLLMDTMAKELSEGEILLALSLWEANTDMYGLECGAYHFKGRLHY